MLMAALFIKAQNGKQSQWSSRENWLNKPCDDRKEQTMETCNNLDGSQEYYANQKNKGQS